MHSIATGTQKYRKTPPNMKTQQQQQQKSINNKPAGSIFFHCVYSIFLLCLSLFIKPTFRCFLQINPFLQRSLQVIHTSTGVSYLLKFWLRHFSETPFCYKKPRGQNIRILIHYVFASCLVSHQAPKGAARCDINTLCRFGAPP